MTSDESIVITGMGSLGAFGAGDADLGKAVDAARPLTTPIGDEETFHAPGASTRALRVTAELSEWLSPLAARRMSPPSRFAVVAARLACRSAALPVDDVADPSLAVSLATAFGPSSFTQRLLDQILSEGPRMASPALFTECVANAPTSQVAIHCKAGGASHTIVGREAGPLLAIGTAAGRIRAGRESRALAGAVEEMPPLLHAALDRFRALARPDEDGTEAARPFDRGRDGFLAAEGSTIFVLESESSARARGARIRARIVAAGSAFDTSAPAWGWGRGATGLADSLRSCLASAGLRVEDVDLVASGASGSRAGDRLEAEVLRRAWGDAPLPPVLATKGLTGEYGGANLALTLLIAEGSLPAIATGFRERDPALGIEPWSGPLDHPRIVLFSEIASGGSAAWLVVRMPHP